MEKHKTIFITGITGNQGGAVAKYLLNDDHTVIGLTRNANSEKAKQWKAKGVTLVEGDLSAPETFQDQLDKADAIFLVQVLQKKENEINQGKRFINAIKPQNKPHLVYSSVLGADRNTGVPHFESKFELEKYIHSKNLRHTILRPASFYENNLYPQVANGIKKGKYVSPLNKDCKQQMIGTDDIGKIAAQVISDDAKYQDKTLSIATDEWKIGDVPKAFSEALNIPVKFKKLPGFITRLAMGKDLSKMFKYMNKNDFKAVENLQNIKDEFSITGDFKSWAKENFKAD
ncbi:MAG: NmrA/HSCARG family protein [Maribacter sp.]|nr:NmrA/HSCARG family protein [Maribacter sp.]